MQLKQMNELLSAGKGIDVPPQSSTISAMRDVGVATAKEVSDKNLVTAQQRLLTTMEEIQKAAGGSSALVRARDLGGAGARLSGELPAEQLRKILAEGAKTDSSWTFKAGKNGVIEAVEVAKHVPGETLTRTQVARAVATKFEHNFGMEILTKTLEYTAKRAASLGTVAEKHANEAWQAGRSVSQEAKETVELAIKEGKLALADAAEKTALKTGAKVGGKVIPAVGLAVVAADALWAGKEAVAATMDGQFKNAGIHTVRAISKAGFGVATQVANVTVVGGVAVAGAGEGVDYWLQQKITDPRAMAANYYKAGIIDNETAAENQEYQKFMKQNPGVANAVGRYHTVKNTLLNQSYGTLQPATMDSLKNLENYHVDLILKGRVNELLPQKSITTAEENPILMP